MSKPCTLRRPFAHGSTKSRLNPSHPAGRPRPQLPPAAPACHPCRRPLQPLKPCACLRHGSAEGHRWVCGGQPPACAVQSRTCVPAVRCWDSCPCIIHRPTTAKLANKPHPAKAPPVATAAVVTPSSSSLVRMTTPSSVSCNAALPPAAAAAAGTAAAEGTAAGSAGAAGCCSACAAGSAPLSSKPSGCASSPHSSCSRVCAAQTEVGGVFLRRAATRSSRLLGQHLVAGRASHVQTMRLQGRPHSPHPVADD